MKKSLIIASWVLGVGALAVLTAFSSQKCETVKLTDLRIQIDYENEQFFVTQNEIQDLVENSYPFLDSLYCKEINIQLLEDELENHPSVRQAEVFSAMDGVLQIWVQQRQPLLRVMNDSGSFYIDENGERMPLSPHYSASVPLVTGDFENRDASVYPFFNSMKDDDFYTHFFTGLDIDSIGKWTLFPKLGNHQIMIGKPDNFESKLRRLKTFYQTVATDQNIDSIASLNLAYEGQVICKKH